ncbi:MAG TPA: hypothetical protein VJS45_06790 [Acidimicrobiia bacterium]|nr:hypothetical protein [Acidimicrobiia bacterium]
MNLLSALVDDAGLFPPESLPMADALARHRADDEASHPMLSGRFLCPGSRLEELRTEWSRLAADRSEPLRLGVILDTGLDGLDAARSEIALDPLLALEMVEVPAPWAEAVTAALDALAGFEPAAFLEGPRSPDWVKAVATAKGPGGLRGAKIRCGGARADLFPSPEELAAFICACFEHGVPFKATAGLHGAVRHRDDQTGFVHHGFLNLALGAVRAAAGRSVDEVAAVLSSTDGTALAGEARAVSGRELSAARLLFRAYGSCSTSEPREEAAALGLLP